MIRPVVLLVPSRAAAVELPRRVALSGRALAGVYAMTVRDLARALAEPRLLGRGLLPWDHGHAALLAAHLLDTTPAFPLPASVPRPPVAAALARTLGTLRLAGASADALEPLAAVAGADDRARLAGLSALWRGYWAAVEGRHADRACLLAAAASGVADADWLAGAEALVTDDLELAPLEQDLLAALAQRIPLRRLARTRPAALRRGSFVEWAEAHAVPEAAPDSTLVAPLAPEAVPAGLQRLREGLFEAPAGTAAADGSVELLTAAGEAAEARAVVRRVLRAAGEGVAFEDMGILLPRPEPYAALFTDLLGLAGVPHRLHPSLPLRTGRRARSLLLLFRCQGLGRAAVMEFLTFVPAPWASLLGADVPARSAAWDALSRRAGIVSGLDRWRTGLRAEAARERAEAAAQQDALRVERGRQRAEDAETLLRLVERLAETLDRLRGEASWAEWRDRLQAAYDEWVAPHGGPVEPLEHQAVRDVIGDLGGLGALSPRAPWPEVESVLEARFADERMPLEAQAAGAVHVGALDALAGVPFRLAAVPGLVEGGFPGVVRPDPFLLDAEREALTAPPPVRGPAAPASRSRQLSLFDAPAAPPPPALATTHDRLREARRAFHRAVSQATERLVLSYPRADPRHGRERQPSLFFVAAAATLHGRPLSSLELAAAVAEDVLDDVPFDDLADRGERDRRRARTGGREAEAALAASAPFFAASRRAARQRWSSRLTAYDGLVAFGLRELAEGPEAEAAARVRARLDPVTGGPVSASRLATYSRCGFQYLLQHVLRLEALEEPEERKRLDPLERGSLFHEVAERFLRERRDTGELPVRDTEEQRRRLLEIADACLEAHVAASPPLFTLLWEKERARFHQTVLDWFAREVRQASRSTPAWFEVSFGPARERAPGEPHSEEPLEVDLGDGRVLRVSGKIDRIDTRADGLVLRDYKTGRAPRDQGGVFRGGRQLQIPFYVLAAQRLFPGRPVVQAFLDYVDAGRPVDFDPAIARGADFQGVLRALVDAIGAGVFVQEPSSCDWCEYTAACGPRGLLEARRRYKLGDPALQRYLRLRDLQ
ncbi:MAG TPA: PD-(D/E)XK nuclease family protein [Vicinamibacteria bacterium]